MLTARAVLPLVLLCSLAAGCSSMSSHLAAGEPYADAIDWPADYTPADAAFYLHHEIDIAASPEVVWSVIVEAESWPDWYSGASDVSVENSPTGALDAEAVFHWRTMGLSFASEIDTFEPYTRLSWESRKRVIRGYHAWLLVPTETGCRLVTDEAQHGFLAVMQRWFLPNRLSNFHAEWLAAIKTRAEQRMQAHAAP